jgi:hypothetical protein
MSDFSKKAKGVSKDVTDILFSSKNNKGRGKYAAGGNVSADDQEQKKYLGGNIMPKAAQGGFGPNKSQFKKGGKVGKGHPVMTEISIGFGAIPRPKRAKRGQDFGMPQPMPQPERRARGGKKAMAAFAEGGNVGREHHFLGALAGIGLPLLGSLLSPIASGIGNKIGGLINKKAEGGYVDDPQQPQRRSRGQGRERHSFGGQAGSPTPMYMCGPGYEQQNAERKAYWEGQQAGRGFSENRPTGGMLGADPRTWSPNPNDGGQPLRKGGRARRCR